MVDAFALAETLQTHGQGHLLEGIDALEADHKDRYLKRLAAIDWAELGHYDEPSADGDDAVQQSRVVDMSERGERAEELAAAGSAVYQAGKVAVLMVAGGMGSRLGFSGPKGCYEVGAHSGKSIYQIQAEKVLDCSRRYGYPVPFLVMTSPVTDAETRDYFAANGDFGLEPGQVRYFSQGTVPSLAADGKGLLKAPGELLENPDGHGGCFTALVDSGTLAEVAGKGISHIVYIQVDNLLVPVDDPQLIGAAVSENADVVTKVLEKAHPDEKVGHLVRVGGRDRIIEYTEVTPEQTRSVNDAGELIYKWGSPAMHCWSVGFLQGLAERGFKPPLHRSKKPLKALVNGEMTEVTGWKCERFIFDLIPQAERSIGFAINRDDEFAPVKNKEGTDSAESARRLVSDCHGRWLTSVGVALELADEHLIEISPRFAGSQTRFAERWDQRMDTIAGNYYLEDNLP